jgi:hypothetical protein
VNVQEGCSYVHALRKEPAYSLLLAEPVTNPGWPCVKSSTAQTQAVVSTVSSWVRLDESPNTLSWLLLAPLHYYVCIINRAPATYLLDTRPKAKEKRMLTTLEIVPVWFAYLVNFVETGALKPILINLKNCNVPYKTSNWSYSMSVCIVTDVQSQTVIEKVTGVKLGTDFHDKSTYRYLLYCRVLTFNRYFTAGSVGREGSVGIATR